LEKQRESIYNSLLITLIKINKEFFTMLRSIMLVCASLLFSQVAQAAAPQMTMEQTIRKIAIEDGVSMDEAAESMKLRANSLNMKLVGHQPLSKELESQGMKGVRRMEIFQFCDAKIANQMVEFNIAFAAYLPCRIAMVEDKDGKAWLITLNMDMMIRMGNLPPEMKDLGMKVRNSVYEILEAGAAGEL
jgi:uncharacterized protein (DUF302 family)